MKVIDSLNSRYTCRAFKQDRVAMDVEVAIVLGIALGYGDSSSIHNQHRTARRPIQEVATLKGF